MNNFIKYLTCPVHKVPLDIIAHSRTSDGVIKHGALACKVCGDIVGAIKFGKVDFLRFSEAKLLNLEEEVVSPPFQYKRVPWSDPAIKYEGFVFDPYTTDTERIERGCQRRSSESGVSSIEIVTDATDLSLRFLSSPWGGAVGIEVNGIHKVDCDLYCELDPAVIAIPVFTNCSGIKVIRITAGDAHNAARGDEILFFGFDACFLSEGKGNFEQINRGNHYPAAFSWCLDHLCQDALVLDCSSGDRKFGDPRVLSCEYMDFAAPDVYCDGHDLPFANDTFDVVFSQAVMEHMKDPFRAAKEIARITKPGGLVYIESAFLQPLHGVPYHFFNTTPWGVEAIFADAGVAVSVSEWFGHLSFSVPWILRSCGGGGLSIHEADTLKNILQKIENNTSYDQLRAGAAAVAYWGIKSGSISVWSDYLKLDSRPSYRY
ncbi:class I SAM-dependent methyltransferase [Ferribacterium limneticum]|uniref:class I SAM-dependent methyltransferase n=1 Tax=Ferribacterium limneticum TaxID=76259 RepID=UPI001CFA2D40|nr:class I SAM-dependent methyltransferase [Ferribacterium limneticum]UCV20755.1 class I SAM-dependent methyltransferase [Ferribacterium limneticum]